MDFLNQRAKPFTLFIGLSKSAVSLLEYEYGAKLIYSRKQLCLVCVLRR